MGFANHNTASKDPPAVIPGIKGPSARDVHCAPNTEDDPQGSNCQAHCVPNQVQDETKRQVIDLVPLYNSLPITDSLSEIDKQLQDILVEKMGVLSSCDFAGFLGS